MTACIRKEERLVNEKFFKINDEKYRDGIKSIGDKIGIVCDAYLRVNLCISLLLR